MKVNEIFYSLQGEGHHSGRPSVFVRLSGCNLARPFCDTDHANHNPMSEAQIVAAVLQHPARWVVLTGGEPALQLTPSLVAALHQAGRQVAVETNGTRPLPEGVDWVTLSPKDPFVGPGYKPVLKQANELKVLFDGIHRPTLYPEIEVGYRYLQPLDTGNPERNATITAQAVAYCLQNPEWQLSLQIHKLLNIK